MKEYEYSAKTVEEAIEKGLEELGLSIGDVDVKVIEEGSKGLFGLFGSRLAKVSLILKENEEDPLDSLIAEEKPARKDAGEKAAPARREPVQRKAARADRQEAPERKASPETEKSPENEGDTEKDAGKDTEPAPRMPAPVRRENKRSADKKKDKKAAVEKPGKTEKTGNAENCGKTEKTEKTEKFDRSNDAERAESQFDAENALPGAEYEAGEPKENLKMDKPEVHMIPAEEIDPESPAGVALDFLKDLTRLMGVEVDIQMGTDDEGNVYGYMNGDTLGILIGRRGETLDAVQYLTSLKVNRGRETYARVTLDTENYRARREDTLIRLANRMANRAVRTGRRVSLEPMNPYERRVIHFALQQNDRVDTHSEGDEPNRHVVITLKK